MTTWLKTLIWTAVGVFILAIAGAAMISRRGARPAIAAPPPPEVSVLTVTRETVSARFEWVGQAEASRRVEVRSQVAGVIVERPYIEGTDVAEGTVLFRIDPRSYEAALRSAQSRLGNAQRTLARLQPLLAARAVAQLDVDNAQTAVEQAQAAFDQAKKDYEDTFVRAGISGRAGRTQMELGGRVAGPGDLLTTIEQVDPIYVNFSPSDAEMLRGRREMADGRLRMPVGALAVQAVLADGTVFPTIGTLNFADLAVQPTTGTNQLRATFANRRHVLLPGQFVRVRILGFTRPGTILVPQRAVQQGLGGAFLYVVGDSDRVAVRNVVATGWRDNAWFIERGLSQGDRVIIDGTQKIGPGQRVKPVAYQPSIDARVVPPDSLRTAPPEVPLPIRSHP
jgi:membrane fusion protein, multidrug efflux system